MGPRVKLRTTDCPRPVLTLEEFSTGARQQRTTRPLVVSHGQLGVEGKKCLNLPGAEVEGRRRWGRVRTGAGGASRCRRGWTLGAAPGTPSSRRTGRGQGGAVCCPHLPPRPPRGDPHGCRGRSSVSSRVPREGGDCGPILPPPPPDSLSSMPRQPEHTALETITACASGLRSVKFAPVCFRENDESLHLMKGLKEMLLNTRL